MEERLSLMIAGLPLLVLDDSPTPSEWLNTRCAAFHAPIRADASIPAIAIHRNPKFIRGTASSVVNLPGKDGGFTLKAVDFTARRQRCGLPIEVDADAEAGLAGILRWVVSPLLIEQGGLLLHAMSFAYEGCGVVAAGPSGRGKTTLARLVRDRVNLFTDEVSAVRFMGEAPIVHATPFAGELGIVSGPASAPLDTLFFLRHAPEMAVRRLDPPEIAARLMGCTFAPLDGGVWLEACLEIAERIARSVTSYELGFRPEPGVWETLQDACQWTVSAA